MKNVIIENKRVFTIVPEDFDPVSLYGERVIRDGNRFLRNWNPYRSKLSASLILGLKISIEQNSKILYLGAAAGTTVSHLSDIVPRGFIYAIEISPFAIKKLLEICEYRKNIIPILEDANHPERYIYLIPKVDMVYQDISQKNQIEIFIKNCKSFLKKSGRGIIMVKSKSIDVSSEPEKIYKKVIHELKRSNFRIEKFIDLKPYAKDHACILVRRN